MMDVIFCLHRLRYNLFTSKGAISLCNTLHQCFSNVIQLELCGNNLGDEFTCALGEYIQNNPSVKYISLSNTQISNKGIDTISEYLLGNTTFNSLDLSDNVYITDESVPFLVDIACKSYVSWIDLERTMISDNETRKIKKMLKISSESREIPIKSTTKSAAKTS